jgi:fucose 4-O-acetylase-like acetyltransferase
MKNRIIFLDVAKAICVILVVIGHYSPDNSPFWYVDLHSIIYTFHMPLFMFASGYIYIATKKDINYGSFIWKKVKRLIVPYIVTSFIIITLKLLSAGNMSVDNPVTLQSYLNMFYLPEAGYFLWFIWALWWMFVLVPLFRTKKLRFLLLIFSIIFYFIPFDLSQIFCLHQFKSMLIYFMFGVFCFENRFVQKSIAEYKLLKVIYLSLLFIGIEILFLLNSDGHGDTTIVKIYNYIGIITPFIGILFIIEISKFICRKWNGNCTNKILMIISGSSYIIYLFHTTFEGFTKAVFHKIPLNSDLWYVFIIESLIIIIMGVVIPLLIHRLILKKFSITQTLFGLK